MVGAYLVGVRSPGEVSQTLQELTVYSNPYYLIYCALRVAGRGQHADLPEVSGRMPVPVGDDGRAGDVSDPLGCFETSRSK